MKSYIVTYALHDRLYRENVSANSYSVNGTSIYFYVRDGAGNNQIVYSCGTYNLISIKEEKKDV